MALRFRRRISLTPGFRINLAKRGASLSIGTRGATVNFGRRGRRVTVGIPGTGLSYSQSSAGSTHEPAAREGKAGQGGVVQGLIGLAFLGLLIWGAVEIFG